MPDIDKIFPSRYLKAADLDGREHILAIKDVQIENVGQTKESKPVLYFRGAQKGLVLNVTNSKRIATMVGSKDTDDWKGFKIVIYPTETEFAGETVDCIRVKAVKGADIQSKAAPKAKATKKAKPVIEEPDDPIPTREPGDEPRETVVLDDDIDASDIPFAWLLPLLLSIGSYLTWA